MSVPGAGFEPESVRRDSDHLEATGNDNGPHSSAALHIRALDARAHRARTQRRALLLFAGLLVVMSLASEQSLYLLAALFIALLEVVPELWYWYGLRGVRVHRRLQYRSVEYGGAVEVELTVENRKLLPLPWLDITDEFPEGLAVVGRQLAPSARIGRAALHLTLALATYQRVRRRYQLLAVGRGVFLFGPTVMSTSDPFGIMQVEGEQDADATLIVHPLVTSLDRFGLPPGAPFGERSATKRLLDDPLRIAGVRDYMPGDEPRRLHWKATARTGALQSKVYQPSTRHALIICLNLRTNPYATAAPDDALTELALSAAASVAVWAHAQHYAFGLIANGSLHITRATPSGGRDALLNSQIAPLVSYDQAGFLNMAPSANALQLVNVLDGLARLLPFTPAPMDTLLERERWRWPSGATVVYIGADAALDIPLLTALRHVRSSGHTVSLLLTRGDEAAAAATTPLSSVDLPTQIIGDRAHWQAMVSDVLGADLAQRLARGSKAAFITTSAGNDASRTVYPGLQGSHNGGGNDASG